MKKILILSISLSFIISACSKQADNKNEPSQQQQDKHKQGSDSLSHEEKKEVILSLEMLSKINLNIAEVKKQRIGSMLEAPARVVPTQTGIAHVGTLIGGRITKLLVKEGTTVRKGQGLATLEGLEIGEVYASFIRSRAEYERAKAEYERQKTLSNENIGSTKSLQEAEATLKQTRSSFQAADKRMHSIGISDEDMEKQSQDMNHRTSELILRSPISGVVSRKNISLGELAEPSKDLFEILDAHTLWIDANVASDEANAVSVGDEARFTNGEGIQVQGKIIYVSPTIEEATRTIIVRAEVPNLGKKLRPQSFGTLTTIAKKDVGRIAIPANALVNDGVARYVFIQENNSTFVRRNVEIGISTKDFIEIKNGLTEGEKIATHDVFYLKSLLKKESMEEEEH